MGALLGFFGASPTRLQALLIGAAAMIVVCLGLTTWAFLERSGRLSCQVERVKLQAQVAVLADSLKRQNDGIEMTIAAADQATKATAGLVAAARKLQGAGASMATRVQGVLDRPTPKRADGSLKDCNEAIGEIKAGAKP